MEEIILGGGCKVGVLLGVWKALPSQTESWRVNNGEGVRPQAEPGLANKSFNQVIS